MLARKHRFSFQKGIPSKTFSSKSFVLRYGRNDEMLKVAVVVGKKVDKRATERNKVKRAIMSIIEKLLDKNSKNTIIIYARKQILENNKENLNEELKEAFKKIRII